MNNDLDGFQEIDVPGDGGCLFYSIALSVLLPSLADPESFKQWFVKLFGNLLVNQAEENRKLLMSYNGKSGWFESENGKNFRKLINSDFRKNLIEFMRRHKSDYQGFIAEDFDTYINEMKKPTAWGGEEEISAASKLLDCSIVVSEYIQNKKQFIQEYLRASSNPVIQLVHTSKEKGSQSKTHYHFEILQEYIPVNDLQSGSASSQNSNHTSVSSSYVTIVKNLDQQNEHNALVYEVEHLLATGHRGTKYQMLVFLNSLLLLMHGEEQFKAGMEFKNFGNLDDIGIIIENDNKPVEIRTYQVKYYVKPIQLEDFYTKEKIEEEAKNQKNKKSDKIHIGKFFDGWLEWKKRYNLSPEQLKPIIYTNTGIGEKLNECLGKGIFSKEFCVGEKKVYVWKSKKPIIIPKNFLGGCKIGEQDKVSDYISGEVWDELHQQGFVDEDRKFTGKELPQNNFTLNLNFRKNRTYKSALKNLTIEKLREAYNDFEKNKVDFYELLHEQAWEYLEKKNRHVELISKSPEEKRDLFNQFIALLYFNINQDDIKTTIEKGIESVKRLSRNQELPIETIAQIYISLYFAIDDWFSQENKDGLAKLIDRNAMNDLIDGAKVQANDIVYLKGRSDGFLREKSYTALINNIFVNNNHQNEVSQKISRQGIITLVGEGGVGKSCLITKVVQCNVIRRRETLFFSGLDLTEDDKLRKILERVAEKSFSYSCIVIDGAESLLKMQGNSSKKFLDFLSTKLKSIVLTIDTHSWQTSFFHQLLQETIFIKPLSISCVLSKFPVLKKYKDNEALMRKACMPIHLKSMIARINILNDFNQHDNAEISNILIRFLIEGENKKEKKLRKRAWIELARNNENHEVKSKQGLELLVKDKIIVQDGNGKYKFQHDLYRQFALRAYYYDKWDREAQEDDVGFWNDNFSDPSWIIYYYSHIKENFISNLSTISLKPYFRELVPHAIIASHCGFLNEYLSNDNNDTAKLINHPHKNILGYIEATYVLIAILHNKSAALTTLIENGASLRYSTPITSENNQYQGEATNDESVSESDKEESSYESNNVKKDGSTSESEEDHYTDDYYYDSEDNARYTNPCSSESDSGEDYLVQPFENIKKFTESPPCKYWATIFYDQVNYSDDDVDNEFGSHFNFEMESCERPDNSKLYLHQSVINESIDCIEILFNHIDKLETVNNYGETALHVAASHSRCRAAKKILECTSIYTDEYDNDDETALHNAAYKGNYDLIKLLLENGADPNLYNKMKLTPFHIVICHLNIDLVKIFFDYGADISKKPFEGEYIDGHEITVADLLEQIGKNQYKLYEVEEFVIELVQLLNFGYDTPEFKWGIECAEVNQEARMNQLNQVKDLMTLIEHRVEISDYLPDFNYTNEESQLEYVVEWEPNFEKLDELQDYILDNPENIEYVLRKDPYRDVASELFFAWLENANEDQFQTIWQYFKDEENEVSENILAMWNDYVSDSSEYIIKFDDDKPADAAEHVNIQFKSLVIAKKVIPKKGDSKEDDSESNLTGKNDRTSPSL